MEIKSQLEFKVREKRNVHIPKIKGRSFFIIKGHVLMFHLNMSYTNITQITLYSVISTQTIIFFGGKRLDQPPCSSNLKKKVRFSLLYSYLVKISLPPRCPNQNSNLALLFRSLAQKPSRLSIRSHELYQHNNPQLQIEI